MHALAANLGVYLPARSTAGMREGGQMPLPKRVLQGPDDPF